MQTHLLNYCTRKHIRNIVQTCFRFPESTCVLKANGYLKVFRKPELPLDFKLNDSLILLLSVLSGLMPLLFFSNTRQNPPTAESQPALLKSSNLSEEN